MPLYLHFLTTWSALGLAVFVFIGWFGVRKEEEEEDPRQEVFRAMMPQQPNIREDVFMIGLIVALWPLFLFAFIMSDDD